MASSAPSSLTNGKRSMAVRRGQAFPPYSNESNGWTTGEQEARSPVNQTTETSRFSTTKPIPGRPRRRQHVTLASPITPKKKKRTSFCRRFHSRWIKGFSPLLIAVALWFLLGVVSIGSSKLLLRNASHHVGNVPPLFLTLQQLFLGSNLLRFLLRIGGSNGLQPLPRTKRSFWKSPARHLLMAGLYFSMGFLLTNYSFQQTSASFVETIKAAEPITSACVAVFWGIETLGPPEVTSLAAIVMGVFMSTYSNATSQHQESAASFADSFQTCCLIMASNLCFSFRGLHQKLFRASSHSGDVDDLNLQFRMQQIGLYIFLVPTLVLHGSGIWKSVWHFSETIGLIQSGVLVRYVSLSLVNGLAFTTYNLASTYILSRISVVHHAALNCTRRVFSIVVTSILFGVPITWVGIVGIVVSTGGFLAFTHYKAKRLRQPKPLSSLLPMSAV